MGLKDIFDTKDMPTQNGCALHKGRQPEHDAYCVSLLRAAGAVILGNDRHRGISRVHPRQDPKSPRPPARNPGGGPSSGSAGGRGRPDDTRRPGHPDQRLHASARFLLRGWWDTNPALGASPAGGVLNQCPSLDQVGVFARSVPDAALLAQVLMAYDDQDPGMALRAYQDLCTGLEGANAVSPTPGPGQIPGMAAGRSRRPGGSSGLMPRAWAPWCGSLSCPRCLIPPCRPTITLCGRR